MVNVNVVGGNDGATFPPAYSNQNSVSIESYTTNYSSLGSALLSPGSYGVLAWNYPNLLATIASAVLTSGVVYVLKVPLAGGSLTVTNILLGVFTAGSTLTSGQCLTGLYDNNGVRVGSSADQSGIWTSTGLKTTALTGGPFTGDWPFVTVVIISNGTTNPAFAKASGSSVGAAFANLSTSGAGIPYATNGTGATSLPSTLTYSSNSGTASNPQSIWVGLS